MTNLESIAIAIKETNQSQFVTPRQLINAVGYERRSPNACRMIDEFLEANDFEVQPHYLNEWVDNKVEVRLKELMDNEARSCSMDYGGITPIYVYRMWGGQVSLDEIESAMSVVIERMRE